MDVCRRAGLSSGELQAIRRYLADVRDALEHLRFLASIEPENVVRDKTLRYSLRYAIILIVEAAVDAAASLLEKLAGASPSSYREAFMMLAEYGVLPVGVAESMARLASLRNLMVHRYWFVDDARVLREARAGGVKAVEEFLRLMEECIEEAGGGEAAAPEDAVGGASEGARRDTRASNGEE